MPVWQGVQRALLPAGGAATSGHVTLLKQKVLTAILRRLDGLLFGKLLAGDLSAAHTLQRLNLQLFLCDREVSSRSLTLNPKCTIAL